MYHATIKLSIPTEVIPSLFYSYAGDGGTLNVGEFVRLVFQVLKTIAPAHIASLCRRGLCYIAYPLLCLLRLSLSLHRQSAVDSEGFAAHKVVLNSK
jgi:hypothetical protein